MAKGIWNNENIGFWIYSSRHRVHDRLRVVRVNIFVDRNADFGMKIGTREQRHQHAADLARFARGHLHDDDVAAARIRQRYDIFNVNKPADVFDTGVEHQLHWKTVQRLRLRNGASTLDRIVDSILAHSDALDVDDRLLQRSMRDRKSVV